MSIGERDGKEPSGSKVEVIMRKWDRSAIIYAEMPEATMFGTLTADVCLADKSSQWQWEPVVVGDPLDLIRGGKISGRGVKKTDIIGSISQTGKPLCVAIVPRGKHGGKCGGASPAKNQQSNRRAPYEG